MNDIKAINRSVTRKFARSAPRAPLCEEIAWNLRPAAGLTSSWIHNIYDDHYQGHDDHKDPNP